MGADIIVQPSEDYKSSIMTKSVQPSKANPNSSQTNIKGTMLSLDGDLPMNKLSTRNRYIEDSQLSTSLVTGRGCCLKYIVVLVCVLYVAALLVLQFTDVFGDFHFARSTNAYFYLVYLPIFNLVGMIVIGRTIVSSLTYPY